MGKTEKTFYSGVCMLLREESQGEERKVAVVPAAAVEEGMR